jgi:hypothetical protein
MNHLLDIKDDPDYWFTQLINDILKSMDTEEETVSDKFLILFKDARKPSNKNIIEYVSETTYEQAYYGNSSDSEYISQFKIYTLRVESSLEYNGKLSDESYIDYNNILCNRVYNTIKMVLNQSTRSNYHFHNILQTSVPKRMTYGDNRQARYDVRFKCTFIKQKERFKSEQEGE